MQVSIGEEITEFNKKISKYPKDKKAIIRTIFDDYAQYQLALYDDFLETLSRFADSGSVSDMISDRTKELGLRLEGYGLKAQIDVANEMMGQLQKGFENYNNESDRLKVQADLEKLKRLFSQKKKEEALADIEGISERIFE